MSDASGASGEVELVQLLTPEGERLEHPEYSFSGDDDQIKGFYRDMVLTRRVDAEATALQRQGELGLWASCLGQEAAQVGSGRALSKRDFVFPTYREHGVAWCLGVDPVHLLGLFRGVDLGGWDSQKYRFHLYTIVIGAQTLHATGYAMAVERDGLVGTGDPDRDMAVVCYFGDGATSEGDVNEAFIFASSYNAPIVFICQNNQWAISEPIERQSPNSLVSQGFWFRLPRRTCRRQRCACGVRGHHSSSGAGAQRQRPILDRGLHLSHGRPHDLRRSDEIPARRRARALAAEGSDRASQGVPDPKRQRRRGLLCRRGGRSLRLGRRPPNSLPGSARPAHAGVL